MCEYVCVCQASDYKTRAKMLRLVQHFYEDKVKARVLGLGLGSGPGLRSGLGLKNLRRCVCVYGGGGVVYVVCVCGGG